MSLREFHLVFVTVAAMFAIGIEFWGIREFALGKGAAYLWYTVLGFLGGIALVYYFGWFNRKCKQWHIH